MSGEVGSKTYKAVLYFARQNNYPIGTKYHLYDYHFKLWCKGKTQEEIANATMTPKEKKRMAKLAADTSKKSKKSDNTIDKDDIQSIVARVIAKGGNSRVIASTSTSVNVSTKKQERLEKAKEKERDIINKKNDDLLRAEWKKANMRALAKTLECVDRLPNAKSAGNGL
jgi:hypothetical protein